MKKLLGILVLVSLLIFLINYIFFFKTEYRVLHAGGIYKNQTYTNSIEALEKNKKGFKYFEIDLQLTKDNKIICEHDINPSILYYDQFLIENSKKTIKSCDYKSLKNWLKKNPEKIIITDVKSNNNLEALKFIQQNFNNYKKNFIPQIYDPQNYELVKNMGYNDIIWTLYRWYGNDKDHKKIISIIKNKSFFAVTMPGDWAKNGLAKRIREETETKTLAQSVNFRRDVVKMIFIYKVTDIHTNRVLNDIDNIFVWLYKKKLSKLWKQLDELLVT